MSMSIGIDLGTTRCCVAVMDRNGFPQTIRNDLGLPTTPSYVLFNNGTILVGNSAINAPNTGKNLIYDSKRLIGRQFDDQAVTTDRKHWSFDVVREFNSANEGKAMIKLVVNGQNKLIAPEEVSAELLKKMKEYAESHLGGNEVRNAVITVPAYFDTRQKAETQKAAELAGLNVLQLLTEPTAAAIALCMKKKHENRIVLIFDLGGGTFDVSIGKMIDGKLEILGIGGLTHLGGEDFDEAIVNAFIADFENKHQVLFPSDMIIRRRLRNQSREAKENMSNTEADQSIEMAVNVNNQNYTHQFSINRRQFYDLCGQMFQGTMAVIDNALTDAKLKVEQVQDILIVGGSTRIPYIRKLIREKLPKATILQNVNPDEAIAIGAAIYAAQLDPQYNAPLTINPENQNGWNNLTEYEAVFMQLDIHEAIPLSIGMELRGGLVQVAIPRGTPYPCTKELTIGTVMDNQPRFVANIFEGERARTKDNIKIGTIQMNNLHKKPRGNMHKTIFEVDGNGILKVTHVELSTGRSQVFNTTYDGPGRNAIDISHFVEQAERFAEEDERFRDICTRRRRFGTHVHHEKGRLESNNRLPQPRIDAALSYINETLDWLDEFPEDSEEIQNRYDSFKNELNSLLYNPNDNDQMEL